MENKNREIIKWITLAFQAINMITSMTHGNISAMLAWLCASLWLILYMANEKGEKR